MQESENEFYVRKDRSGLSVFTYQCWIPNGWESDGKMANFYTIFANQWYHEYSMKPWG